MTNASSQKYQTLWPPLGCIFPLCPHAQGIMRMACELSSYRWTPLEASPRSSHALSAWAQLRIFTIQPVITPLHSFRFPIYHSFLESWWREIFSSRGSNIKLKRHFWWNGEIIPLLSFEQKNSTWGSSGDFVIDRLERNNGFSWTSFSLNLLEHLGMKRWERQVLDNRTNPAPTYLHNFV